MDLDNFVETIKTIWCVNCGNSNWGGKGYAENGKRRIKCKVCSKCTTIGALPPGTKTFKPERLLPVLTKNQSLLNREELYSLGFLMADGCRKSSKKNIDNMCLSLDIKDAYILDTIQQALKFPNTPKEYKRNKIYNGNSYIEHYKIISWSNNYAGSYWDKLGLFKNKTGNEVFLDYMCNSDFLRGLYDGDGNICFDEIRKTGRIELASASKKFLEDILEFFKSVLNVDQGSIYVRNKGKNDWYSLCFHHKSSLEIGNYLYRNSEGLRLERKYQKYLQIKNRHN